MKKNRARFCMNRILGNHRIQTKNRHKKKLFQQYRLNQMDFCVYEISELEIVMNQALCVIYKPLIQNYASCKRIKPTHNNQFNSISSHPLDL